MNFIDRELKLILENKLILNHQTFLILQNSTIRNFPILAIFLKLQKKLKQICDQY